MGLAYVVTLAGGPASHLSASLATLPGVLEIVSGVTGRAASPNLRHGGDPPQGPSHGPPQDPPQGPPTYDEVCTSGSGLVEAVQLAVDPALPLEVVLDAYWAASSTCYGDDGGAAQHTPAIFYHSASQLESAMASRGRMQQARPHAAATSIRPATVFWEQASPLSAPGVPYVTVP